jgi:4-aminobutyrate aminotransferase
MEQETIRLLTEIPGPRSRALMERHRRSISPAMGILHPVFAAEAEDATITDVDGNRFIDFTGGVGCLNVGHANPRVLAAASEQLQRFTHTDYTVVPYPVYIEVAERLLDLSPFPEGRAVFFNSGAEAVENAVKVAKLHTKRSALMAYEGAFHGRTQLALSLTYKSKPYREGLGPFVPGVYRLPYPNAYRGPSVDEALAAIEHAFSYAVSPDDVAAVIIEPVLGEGGFVVAPADYLRELRAICDQHDIMLVVDEVQTGFGRTGRMFAVEHAGIVPDLMTLAKSLAGGLPLSAVLGKAAVMDSAPDGSLGGTFVGNPVALAAANGVLDTFESDDLLAREWSPGASASRRSATCAGSARCWL